MHDHGRLTLARLVVPLALVAFAVAVAAMVLGSGVVGDDSTDGNNATSDLPAATERSTTSGRPTKRRRATYTIKANDTLSGIAAQHGTTVDRLQELNPEIDPQGLVAGQKIKLRE
jgi:LysM repeat protein